MSQKKSQAAIEYLMVISVALALLSPIVVIAQRTLYDLNTSANLLQAHEALLKIKEGCDVVYSQGPPSRLTFYVALPTRMENMYSEGKGLVISVKYKNTTIDVIQIFDYDIWLGGHPKKGLNKVVVTAYSGYVNITFG